MEKNTQKFFNYSNILFDSEQDIRERLKEISQRFEYAEKWEREYYFLFNINGRHYLPTEEVLEKVLAKRKIRFLGVYPRTFINKETLETYTGFPGFYQRDTLFYISNFSASPQGDTEEKRKALSETDSVDILIEVYRSRERDLCTSQKIFFSPRKMMRRIIFKLRKVLFKIKRLKKLTSY